MKMHDKKIGVITIYGEENYGNRLQNYAVIKYLNNLGYNAQTLVVMPKRFLKKKIKDNIKNIVAYVLKNKYLSRTRKNNFIKFTKKYIPTRYIKTEGFNIPNSVSDEYDFFVVGSDQVWNPTFGRYEKDYNNMFLFFTVPEKKICFSPSIGISEIPQNWTKQFKKGLDTFEYISIREEDGAKLVKELCGKDAQVLIDPTMMLEKEDWLNISNIKNKIKENYILEYFLGDCEQNLEEFLSKKSSLENLKRIKILDKSNPDIYVSGPSEFITLIAEASLVVTDSFHACVFSILFDVPFIIVKRKDFNNDMFSRIRTLLNMFEIDAEKIDFNKPIQISKEKRNQILKEQRDRVNSFFEKCLKEKR